MKFPWKGLRLHLFSEANRKSPGNCSAVRWTESGRWHSYWKFILVLWKAMKNIEKPSHDHTRIWNIKKRTTKKKFMFLHDFTPHILTSLWQISPYFFTLTFCNKLWSKCTLIFMTCFCNWRFFFRLQKSQNSPFEGRCHSNTSTRWCTTTMGLGSSENIFSHFNGGHVTTWCLEWLLRLFHGWSQHISWIFMVDWTVIFFDQLLGTNL